ncbi:C40 family peptidase [Nocardia sp. NPDC088792]|uniref:C40 family peptidase n=1 Tax=Nocardia sp. NPDC088792 TaxID=3364332 RepID=UPI0038155947
MSGEFEGVGLAAPIVELLAGFGAGSGVRDAADGLRAASATVDDVHAGGRGSVDGMYEAWRGRGGDAAMGKALQVQDGAAMVSERGRDIAAVLDRVGDEVSGGQREVQEILRSFLESVKGLEAGGVTPAAVTAIVGSAIDHVGRAVRVVERVRAELARATAAMSELVAPPPMPEPAAPAVVPPAGAAAVSPGASGVVPAAVESGDRVRQAATVASDGGRALGAGVQTADRLGTAPASYDTVPASYGDSHGPDHRRDPRPARQQSKGVRVTLPDGSTVEAPNQQAADAVRAALSAVGTPYVWGGTTPGAGLDCSGLTQWAYAQAGVRLPRLAQEQGFGHAQVSPGDLMPGDLAVWDGHVAMVIGHGEIVEAGDPVQVGPIRTENMGMRFLGFYRPTA